MKNKNLKNILIIFALSTAITFTFDYFLGGVSNDLISVLLNITYGFVIGSTIAFSGTITRVVMSKLDIQSKPVQTYTILLFTIFFYITADVFIINALWYKLTQGAPLYTVFTNSGLLVTSLLTIFIGIIIFFVLLSKNFISKFVDAEKEIREAKEESAKFQYETLKNQINPHFLFNSLNVLSALVYKDAEKADEFIIHLSDIYRYILDHQDDELVKLESEIIFIQKYAYLQSIRFDKNFTIEIDSWERFKDTYLVPMALQLVVENVFKHNVISDQTPVKVKIEFRKNYISISNNLNLKKRTELSHHVGLKNIEKRYQILSDKKCEFAKTKTHFIVRLPLLKIQA